MSHHHLSWGKQRVIRFEDHLAVVALPSSVDEELGDRRSSQWRWRAASR